MRESCLLKTKQKLSLELRGSITTTLTPQGLRKIPTFSRNRQSGLKGIAIAFEFVCGDILETNLTHDIFSYMSQ
jgi:hypothetical protein